MKKQTPILGLGCILMAGMLVMGGCGMAEFAQAPAPVQEAPVVIEPEEVPLDAAPQTTVEKEVLPTPEAEETQAPVQKQETKGTDSSEAVQEVSPALVQEDPIAVEIPAEDVQVKTFDAQALTSAVIARVNEVRSANGLGSLTATPELASAASVRAKELETSFSHQRPNGSDYATAVAEAGASAGYVGENVFSGFSTVEGVEKAWNDSSIHLENILDGNFKSIGVACVETSKGIYLVQIFTD